MSRLRGAGKVLRQVLRVRSAELLSALLTVLLLGSLGSAWNQLGNPLGDGDLLGTYGARTVPWGRTVGGFPFGMELFPYFQTLDVIPETVADAISRLTGNAYLGVNLIWLGSFPICAALSCWLLRKVGASVSVAVALSVAYTFIPYHWMRGFAHPYLATMWSAVLGTCLALLIGSGRIDEIWREGRRHSRLWSGRLALIGVSVVVAWSGIYYAFFSFLLMSVALGWLWLGGADGRTVLRSAVPIAVVVIAVSGVLVASGLAARGDQPSEPIAVRNALQSTTYAGSIAFLMVPSPVSSFPGADNFGHALDPYIRPDIESLGYSQFGSVITTASIAIYLIGGMALVRRRRSGRANSIEPGTVGLPVPPTLVTVLLAVSLLFFVPWSANFLFALWLSPGIRSWDRLLPIILLLLLAGATQVSKQLGWFGQGHRTSTLALAIFFVTLLDGVAPYPSVVRGALQVGSDLKRSGDTYAAAVNLQVPQQCGVLQLPYVPFPEKGFPIGTMDDYQHFLVALTNSGKDWSYGAVKFTRASRWAARLADRLTEADVQALHEGGICGVHVDMTGYLFGDRAPAVARLKALLGEPVAEGHGGQWQFFIIDGSGPVRDVRDEDSLTPTTRRFFYPAG